MIPRYSLRKCGSFFLDPVLLVGAFFISALFILHPRISALVYERSYSDDFVQDNANIKSWNENEGYIKLSLSMKNVVENPVSILLEQDEIWLINFIRKNYLHPPSKLSYNLEQKISGLRDTPSFKKAEEVITLLKKKDKGTFVQCGDGEFHSATLPLEALYGWTGAIIEANPKNFEKLIKKHRRVWSVSAGITPFPFPKKMSVNTRTSALALNKESEIKAETYEAVQCFPLYSSLLALNMTKIDYLSLQSEGLELDILSTVPWNKVEIKVLSIDCKDTEYEKKEAIKDFMGHHEYSEKSLSQNEYLIFVNSKYLK